ncbi:MAG: hypothetical protein HY735_08915 [Verrucomicrobia bacterium]|nr:hypothetical protein [Verrucomicrobiota bacterium]
MKARIKKEIRAILPAWSVALALAVFVAMRPRIEMPVWILVYWLGLVGLAVAAFGSEISSQTLTLLLAQPVKRTSIWREKASILALALGTVVMTFSLVGAAANTLPFVLGTGSPWIETALIAPICAFGGGVSSTLLLKHLHGAFWLATLLPLFLITVVPIAMQKWFGLADTSGVLYPALIAYGVLGAAVARWRFLTMQDVSPVPAEFSLSFEKLAKLTRSRTQSSVISLLWKEVLLQQINWILALGMILALLATALVEPALSRENKAQLPIVRGLLFYLLSGLFPLLTGAVAIAEERRLGLLGWQQTLPASRRRQWGIKLGVCGTLVLVFGCIAPALLYPFVTPFETFEPAKSYTPMGGFFLVNLVFFVSGLLASSAARNPLQAMLAAVGLIIAVVTVLTKAPRTIGQIGDIKPGPLLNLIADPLLLVAGVICAYWNYRTGRVTKRLILQNGGVLVATFIVGLVVTAFVYHRTWEKLAKEPGPDRVKAPARKVDPSVMPAAPWLFVLGPDGTLWGSYESERISASSKKRTLAKMLRLPESPEWRSVSCAGDSGLAIDAGGSLWAWGWNHQGRLGVGGEIRNLLKPNKLETIQQVGTDTNWVAVSMGGRHSLGLKADGSLWAWGANNHGQLGITGIRIASTPEQVGQDHDWVSVVAHYFGSVAAKNDGTLWNWGMPNPSYQVPFPAKVGNNTDWVEVKPSGYTYTAVKKNGTLWAASPPMWLIGTGVGPSPGSPIRLSFDFKPRDYSFDPLGALAIKSDGTLWQWDGLKERHQWGVHPVQVGHRNDWLDVAVEMGSCIGLTSDGWVWRWGRPSLPEYPPRFHWLPYSQKPKRLLNVYTGQVGER